MTLERIRDIGVGVSMCNNERGMEKVSKEMEEAEKKCIEALQSKKEFLRER